ncbi:MAG: hypothetical protein RJB25_249 [Bacteroidota bacterium]
MKQVSALVKAHPYLTTYLFVYALLQIGLLNHSGLTYAPALFFLFLLPFLLAYWIFSPISFSFAFPQQNFKHLEKYFFIFSLLVW